MKPYKLIGVTLLLIAAGMAFLPVMGGFGMSGLHTGLVMFCGLGGMWLICS